jgi:hypothetical protein
MIEATVDGGSILKTETKGWLMMSEVVDQELLSQT